MWTLPTGWLAAMRRSGNQPVVVARIITQPWAYIDVTDFSAAEVDPLIADEIHVGVVTLQAGVDFLAVGSNETTASNIADAFNTVALDEYMWARAEGTRVYFIQRDYTGDFAAGTIENWALGVEITDFTGADITTWAFVGADGLPAFHRFCSGQTALFGYPNHIDKISPIEFEIDPVERVFNMSGVDITFGQRGALIRRLMKFHDLMSVPVTLYLGTHELAFSSFLQFPTVLVQDVESTDQTVILKCRGADALFQGARIQGAFVSDHPLQVVEAALTEGGITNATTYPNLSTSIFDFTTLDPADYPDRGHFNVSRYNATDGGDISPEMKNTITEPEPVWNIMQDMAMLMYGGFMPDQDGIWGYRNYDPLATPVYTFNAGEQDDAFPGYFLRDFRCRAGGTNAITELEWELTGVGEVGNESSVVVRRFAFNQNFNHRQARKTTMSTQWLNGVFRFLDIPIPQPDTADGGTENKIGFEARAISYQFTGATDAGSGLYDDTTDFHTNGAARQGACGARFTFNTTTWQFEQPLEATLDADPGNPGTGRRAFFMFVGPGGLNQIPSGAGTTFVEFDEVEIMAINYLELTDLSEMDARNVWDDLRAGGNTTHAVPAQYNIRAHIDSAYTQGGFNGFTAGRGGYGTSIPNTWGTVSAVSGGGGPAVSTLPYIVDVTIPMVISDIILDRFMYGAPEISFSTPLHEIDKEPTDFVYCLGAETYLGYTSDGSSEAQIFEITKKRIDIFGQTPGIQWECVLVRNDDLPTPPDAISPDFDNPVISVQIPDSGGDVVTDNSLVTVMIDADEDGFEDTIVYRG